MTAHDLSARAAERLEALCSTHPDRHVGGPGVAAANELFAREAQAAGFGVERLPFDCVDWESGSASLRLADGRDLALHVGPYSPPYRGEAPLVTCSRVEELEALDAPGSILLLHGAIAEEQLTPRHYPFYQMDSHVRILAAIDRARPGAVIAATDRTPMAGALYPFPLFEDADLGWPSAYLTDVDGAPLVAHDGEVVSLEIDSRQVAATGEQLVCSRAGTGGGRVLVSAHIDSRHGTPGALDNATGVCVLLALADLLSESGSALTIELVPFNGEDNFAAYGEMAYLAKHEDSLGDVVLAINIDAAARIGDESAISFYGCPDQLAATVRAVAADAEHIVEGPEWPMSDHMVLAMRGVPAMAITSTGLFDIEATVAHTAADTPELANPEIIVATARFIASVIEALA
ncbi:MAG: M28 family peptidase [Coriobacteriia bacterium]|nr:M28 family peptidase [Coriobacteriia bacterium]